MEVKFFEGTAKFSQKVKLTGGNYLITGYLEYGACNDQNCLPPTSVDFLIKEQLPQLLLLHRPLPRVKKKLLPANLPKQQTLRQ